MLLLSFQRVETGKQQQQQEDTIYIQAKINDASSALASINKIAAQSKAPQNLFVFVSAWQWQWVRKMVIRVIFHFWLGLLLPILLLTTLGRKTAPYLHIDSK
jgi:hypothetical protein